MNLPQDHPPQSGPYRKSVRDPDEYEGGKSLTVWCTQRHDMSPYQQKKLVTRWCEALPEMQQLEVLSLASRVPQRLFDAACRLTRLRELSIKWNAIESLEPIRAMTGLRDLSLGGSARVESIEPLAELTKLRSLQIDSTKRISKLDPLTSLTQLVELGFEGGIDRTVVVDTLAPIGQLHGLQFLSLINLRARDKTLKPLYPLRLLQELRIARWWSEEEELEIRRLNPLIQ